MVLLDNGRTDMLGTPFQEALRCIRCGACMNHCAVYGAVGGHAYESVYPGPIGQVLSPLLFGLDSALDSITACTQNGHCGQVCPMSIPLPELIRQHRVAAFEQKKTSAAERAGLAAWKKLALNPRLYRWATGIDSWGIRLLNRYPGLQRITPFLKGWTAGRGLMSSAGKTFQSQLAQRKRDA